MPQFLVANDLHLADNPPASRTVAYFDEGLSMLGETVALANEYKCEALVFTGDMFHIKKPERNSHGLVARVIGELAEAKMPVFITPGNHDLGPGGMDALHEQPLGVIEAAGVAECSFMSTTDHFMFFSKPYNEKYDTDPDYYHPDPQDLMRARGRQVVVVAHGSIVPDGTEREFPTIPVSKVLHGPVDILVSGHIHEDLGIQRIGEKLFANIGALGRTARTKANMTRYVKVAVISDTKGIIEIPLKSALTPEQAFKPEAPVIDSEEEDETIRAFIEAMSKDAKFEQMEIKDFVRAACDEAGVGPELEQRLLSFLEE